jgi:CBS domain-containing protein
VNQSKVSEVMTAAVKFCPLEGSVNSAAQVMWENDCGCVPIVDQQTRVVGIVTDRDLAMATYTQGRPLFDIALEPIMSKKVITCGPDDTVSFALKLMRDAKVHRLPVVDDQSKLVGILSLSDISREIEIEIAGVRNNPAIELADVVATIRKPRPPVTVVALQGGVVDGAVKAAMPRKRSPRKKKDPSQRPAKP